MSHYLFVISFPCPLSFTIMSLNTILPDVFSVSSELTIHHTFCFLPASTPPLHTYTQLWHRLSLSGIPQILFIGAVLWEVYKYHGFSGDHGLWLWNSLGGVSIVFMGWEVCAGQAVQTLLHSGSVTITFFLVWPCILLCALWIASLVVFIFYSLFELFRFCSHTEVMQ